MKKILTIVIILTIIIILSLLFFYTKIQYLYPYGFTKEQFSLELVIKPVLISIFTLLGVYSKILYSILDETEGKYISFNLFFDVFRYKRFWMALCVSPIILLSFYKTIENITSYALTALIAFENGFFFKSILSDKAKLKKSDSQ